MYMYLYIWIMHCWICDILGTWLFNLRHIQKFIKLADRRASRAVLSLSVLEIHGSVWDWEIHEDILILSKMFCFRNRYFEKRKTLYNHQITHRNQFWKNPEKFRIRFFSGIRIFGNFLHHVTQGNLENQNSQKSVENCRPKVGKRHKNPVFSRNPDFSGFFFILNLGNFM